MSHTMEPVHEHGIELEVEFLLRRLRISGTLIGFRFLVYAIVETIRDPERTCFITKELYPDIAKRYGSQDTRVERAIRHSIKQGWTNGWRELLDEIAGFHLAKRPANAEFIDLLAFHFRHT